MRRIVPTRRNPVARALALPMLKLRIVPKRIDERRVKDKLRQSLQQYRFAGSIQPKKCFSG